MTYKRLCLSAPNDYNIGLCDYVAMARLKLSKNATFEFWSQYIINVA